MKLYIQSKLARLFSISELNTSTQLIMHYIFSKYGSHNLWRFITLDHHVSKSRLIEMQYAKADKDTKNKSHMHMQKIMLENKKNGARQDNNEAQNHPSIHQPINNE